MSKRGKNRAILDGEFIQPNEFLREILLGFEKTYMFFAQNKSRVFEKLKEFEDLPKFPYFCFQLPIPSQPKLDIPHAQSNSHNAYLQNLKDNQYPKEPHFFHNIVLLHHKKCKVDWAPNYTNHIPLCPK